MPHRYAKASVASRSPRRSRRRRVPLAALLLALLSLTPRPAVAQGNESTTSTQGSHTNAVPPPLLSTDSVTAVDSGKPRAGPGLSPDMRPRRATGLASAGPISLRAPARLSCQGIGEATARARCQARKTPPPPPMEQSP